MSAPMSFKWRDTNLNLNDEAHTPLWSPSNIDGSGWTVATGKGNAEGGAVDKSSGLGGFSIALGAAAVVAVVLLMRRKG